MKTKEFVLDPENKEFAQAVDWCKHHDSGVFYLTGKAGSGKSTYIKYIRDNYPKGLFLLAPTGVAAVNIAGQTIHSLFLLPPSDYYNVEDPKFLNSIISQYYRSNSAKLKILKSIKCLIIDEISMVRADTIDLLNCILQKVNHSNMPFGNIKVILVGDVFQLPPIVKEQGKDLMRGVYKTSFFFSSKVIKKLIREEKLLFIELEKIYRQSDKDFVSLLNRVRIGETSINDFQALTAKYVHDLDIDTIDDIVLVTHKDAAKNINDRKLAKLLTPLLAFDASVTGSFADSELPISNPLLLKVGARVMTAVNNIPYYYNGKTGSIEEIDDVSAQIKIKFDDGSYAVVQKHTWQKSTREWDDEKEESVEKIIGTFEQYPLRLAYAITIHKSQGLTFEKAVIDAGKSFTDGQVYVALSRCVSLRGIKLRSEIYSSAIKVSSDAIAFAKYKTPSTLVDHSIINAKADALYAECWSWLYSNDFDKAWICLSEAITLRNDIKEERIARFLRLKTFLIRNFRDKEQHAVARDRQTLLELDRDNIILKESFNELTRIKQTQDVTIDKLHDRCRELNDKILDYMTMEVSFKDSHVKLTASLQDADNRSSILNQSISDLREQSSNVNDKNLHLAQSLESMKAIIMKLEKRSFWDYLFGRK